MDDAARRVEREDGIVLEPLQRIVDPDNFTPRLVSILSNALVSRESSELRRRFGIGTNEWRVLSALATKPGSSATEVSEFLILNPALISRSVSTLVKRDLVVLSDGP
ncbi:MAG: MarR family transcriptional regulator, partial [Microbacterium chocolatum]|nr:MarR family transcriptional regulator [Microbacterium chocolatum]